MILSCSCRDFDNGDFDSWWEASTLTAPAGTRCCECNAPIPEGTPCAGFISYEVWEPEDIEDEPPDPEHVLGDEPECSVLSRHWEHLHLEMEIAREIWFEDRGYDYDCERFERETGRQYRCDRCAGLATALDGDENEGGLGFCVILPGDLIEAHRDYIEQAGRHEMIWVRDRNGVLNPRRLTRLDFAKREARRRWRNAVYIVFRGGWRHKVAMAQAKTVGRTIHVITSRLGYVYHYDCDAKTYRWTRPDKSPQA